MSQEQDITTFKLEVMQQNFDTHRVETKAEFKWMSDRFDRFEDKIDKLYEALDNEYVRKEDHEENKKRIAELEKKRESVMSEVIKYGITFVLSVVTALVMIKLWLK